MENIIGKFYTYCNIVGNSVFIRGCEDGKSFLRKVPFKPTLFIRAKGPSEWKSLYEKEPLEPVKFDSIREAKDFLERYKEVEGFAVHGFPRWQYQYLNEEFPHDITYNIDDVSTLYFDIETVDETGQQKGFPNIQDAKVPIVLISLYNTKDEKVIVLGLKPYDMDPEDEFEYKQFSTEEELLKYFIAYNQLKKPDNWSGWNTSGFDIPYLCNRIVRLFGVDMLKRISPFEHVSEKTIQIRGEDVRSYDIFGINDLDLLDLYKNFGTLNAQEAYTLGYISQVELKETKHELPGNSFYDNYVNHTHEFIKYSAKDTILVKKINDKKKLIELALSLSFLYKCTLGDIYRTVMPWEIFIYNHLSKKKIAVPPRKNIPDHPYEGAWVKDPKPGMYDWCMTFDFSSLYPSVIRQWNISPETFVNSIYDVGVKDFQNQTENAKLSIEYAKENNLSIAANGTMYKKDEQGFLAEMMEIVMEGRKEVKNEMMRLKKLNDESLKSEISALDSKQNAFKVAANSAYGAAGSGGFHYYNWRMAEAITLNGQISDMDVANSLSERMNVIMKTKDVDYIIGADTDSVFLDCSSLVNTVAKGKTDIQITKFLDVFAEQECQKVINSSVSSIFEMMNGFDNVMSSKREAIASKMLYRKKKNYAMYVLNSEGVDLVGDDRLKVMGIEIVKSSTPQWCRKKLKELLRMIFESDEQTFRKKFEEAKKEFYNLKPEEVAKPSGVTDIDKWVDKERMYKKGCPIHVRASILYNQHGKDVVQDFSPISNGDKMKFVYLKVPNPVRENVFGFPAGGNIPEELGLKKFVDYDELFDGTFKSPLESLTNIAGWAIEEKSSLDDFFG